MDWETSRLGLNPSSNLELCAGMEILLFQTNQILTVEKYQEGNSLVMCASLFQTNDKNLIANITFICTAV